MRIRLVLALCATLASGLEAQACGMLRNCSASKTDSVSVSRSQAVSVPVQPVAPVVTAPQGASSTPHAEHMDSSKTKPVSTGAPNKPSGISTRQSSATARNDRFDTSEACLSALASGSARFYQPTYFNPVRLSSGERTLPLEHAACVRMQIVGGTAWVPQAQGTKLDFKGTTPLRRTDCGNKVYAVVYPTAPVVQGRVDSVFMINTHRTIFQRDSTIQKTVVLDTRPHRSSWLERNWWKVGLVAAASCAGYGMIVNEDWRKPYCISMRNENKGIDIGPTLTGASVRIWLP